MASSSVPVTIGCQPAEAKGVAVPNLLSTILTGVAIALIEAMVVRLAKKALFATR